MSRQSSGKELALLKSPLLVSESVHEFDALYRALERDVAPRSVIERMYVAEICNHVWEILRLRRCKAAIINKAFYSELTETLIHLLPKSDQHSETDEEPKEHSDGSEELEEYTYADQEPLPLLPDLPEPSFNWEKWKEANCLALAWFSDSKAKKRIVQLLAQDQLDESAIEAAAIKNCYEDLERLDKMIILSEARRDKALRSIGEYRDSLARQLRESSDRMIEGKSVLRLEHVSGKKSAA